MKRIILIFVTLISITNLSYASFPVIDGLNYAFSAPLDNGLKSLLWGILSIPFFAFVFPSILAIKYGISAWNSRNYIASRIGLTLGVIGLLMVLVALVAFLGAMTLGAAFGG